MKVFCERYPELNIADLGVTFSGGVAEVIYEVAAKMNQMDGFNFVFDSDFYDEPSEESESGEEQTEKENKKDDEPLENTKTTTRRKAKEEGDAKLRDE